MKDLFDLSTSTYVYGIKPPDEQWRRMKAIYDSCSAADVAIPEEVLAFFNWEEPDPAGVVVDISGEEAVRVWSGGPDSMREGVEVELARVPEGIRFVRFVNSY